MTHRRITPTVHFIITNFVGNDIDKKVKKERQIISCIKINEKLGMALRQLAFIGNVLNELSIYYEYRWYI